jgi:hypothetical protein
MAVSETDKVDRAEAEAYIADMVNLQVTLAGNILVLPDIPRKEAARKIDEWCADLRAGLAHQKLYAYTSQGLTHWAVPGAVVLAMNIMERRTGGLEERMVAANEKLAEASLRRARAEEHGDEWRYGKNGEDE